MKQSVLKFIKDKGLDYMVEVELGGAPPLEFILRNKAIKEKNGNNINSDDNESSEDEENMTVDDMIKSVQV